MLGPQPRHVGSSPAMGTMQCTKLAKCGSIFEIGDQNEIKLIKRISDVSENLIKKGKKKHKGKNGHRNFALLLEFRQDLLMCEKIRKKTGRYVTTREVMFMLPKINAYLIDSYDQSEISNMMKQDNDFFEDDDLTFTGISDLDRKMQNARNFWSKSYVK